MLSCFYLTAIDSQGTVHWFLGWLVWTQLLLLYKQSQSFHIHHLEYAFQKSPEEYQTYFLQLLYIDCLYNHVLIKV